MSTPARWWWRAHSVRVRLTLWYIAAMLVVLAVYAAVVFTFVRRNLSAALDQQLRSDFSWAAAMVDQTPQGTITFYQGDEEFGDQELPWLQVWSPNGAQLLYSNFEAQRRPVPGTRALAARADNDQIVSVPASPVPAITGMRPATCCTANASRRSNSSCSSMCASPVEPATTTACVPPAS